MITLNNEEMSMYREDKCQADISARDPRTN